MTNEEAIKTLKGEAWISCAEKWNEALDMAIKALDQEPCGDDVLDKIKRDIFNACSDNYHMPVYKLDCDKIFEIIDKYKAEGSEK